MEEIDIYNKIQIKNPLSDIDIYSKLKNIISYEIIKNIYLLITTIESIKKIFVDYTTNYNTCKTDGLIENADTFNNITDTYNSLIKDDFLNNTQIIDTYNELYTNINTANDELITLLNNNKIKLVDQLILFSIKEFENVINATDNINDFAKVANKNIAIHVIDNVNSIENINNFTKVANKNIENIFENVNTIQNINNFTKVAMYDFSHLDDAEIQIIIKQIIEKYNLKKNEFETVSSNYLRIQSIIVEKKNAFDKNYENFDEKYKEEFEEKKNAFDEKYKEFEDKKNAFDKKYKEFEDKKNAFDEKKNTDFNENNYNQEGGGKYYGGADNNLKEYFKIYLQELNYTVVNNDVENLEIDTIFLEEISKFLDEIPSIDTDKILLDEISGSVVNNYINTGISNVTNFQTVNNFIGIANKNIKNVLEYIDTAYTIQEFSDLSVKKHINIIDNVNTIQTINNFTDFSIKSFSDNDIFVIIHTIDKKHDELDAIYISIDVNNIEIEEKIAEINNNNNIEKYNQQKEIYNQQKEKYNQQKEEYNQQTEKYIPFQNGGGINVNPITFFRKHLNYLNSQILEGFHKLQQDFISEINIVLDQIKQEYITQKTDELIEFQNSSIIYISSVSENTAERDVNGFLHFAITNLSENDNIIQNKVITENITHFEQVAIRSFTVLLTTGYLNKIAENIFEMFKILKLKYKLTNIRQNIIDVLNNLTIEEKKKYLEIVELQQKFVSEIASGFGVVYKDDLKNVQKLLPNAVKNRLTLENNTFSYQIKQYFDEKNDTVLKEALKAKIIAQIKNDIISNISETIQNETKTRFDEFDRIAIKELDDVSNYKTNLDKKVNDTEGIINNFQNTAIKQLRETDYFNKRAVVAVKKVVKALVKDRGILPLFSNIKNTTSKIDKFKSTSIRELDNIVSIKNTLPVVQKSSILSNVSSILNIKPKSPEYKLYKETSNKIDIFKSIAVNSLDTAIKELKSVLEKTRKEMEKKQADTIKKTEQFEKTANKSLSSLIPKKSIFKSLSSLIPKKSKPNFLPEENKSMVVGQIPPYTQENMIGGDGTLNKEDKVLIKNSEAIKKLYDKSIELLNKIKTSYKEKFLLSDDIEKNFNLISTFYNKYKGTYLKNATELFNQYIIIKNKLKEKTKRSFKGGAGNPDNSVNLIFNELLNNEMYMINYGYPAKKFFENYNDDGKVKRVDTGSNIIAAVKQPRQITINDPSNYPQNYLDKMEAIIKIDKFPQVAIQQIENISSKIKEKENLEKNIQTNAQNVDEFIFTSIDNISDIADVPKYHTKLTKLNIDEFIKSAIFIFQSTIGEPDSNNTTITDGLQGSSSSNNQLVIGSEGLLNSDIGDKHVIQIESEISNGDKQLPYNIYLNPVDNKIKIYKGNQLLDTPV